MWLIKLQQHLLPGPIFLKQIFKQTRKCSVRMDAIWQVFGVNSKNQLTSKHKPITMRDILLQPIAFHASSAFHVVQNVLQRALIGFPQYLLNVWNTAVLNYNNEFRCTLQCTLWTVVKISEQLEQTSTFFCLTL